MILPRAPYKAGQQEGLSYEEKLPLVQEFTRVRINDETMQTRSDYQTIVFAA